MTLPHVAWRIGPTNAQVAALFDDDFSAGNTASPRPATPGPGHSRIVDTNAALSVTGGSLHINGTTALTDGLVYASAANTPLRVNPQAGRALGIQISQRVATTSGMRLGWAALDLAGTDIACGLDYGAPGERIKDGVVAISHMVLGGSIQRWVMLMWAGGYLLLGQADSTVPRLMWVYNTTPAAVYAKLLLAATTLNVQVDRWLVADTALSEADWLYASATTPPASFNHPADFLLDFVLTAMPSGADFAVQFRQADSNTYWRVTISPTGTWTLLEYNAANPSGIARSSASGVVAGTRLLLIADGTRIRTYQNNAVALQYDSATNPTATIGAVTLGGALATTWRVWHGRATAATQAKLEEVWA